MFANEPDPITYIFPNTTATTGVRAVATTELAHKSNKAETHQEKMLVL